MSLIGLKEITQKLQVLSSHMVGGGIHGPVCGAHLHLRIALLREVLCALGSSVLRSSTTWSYPPQKSRGDKLARAFSGDDMLAAATGAHRDGANLRVDISLTPGRDANATASR